MTTDEKIKRIQHIMDTIEPNKITILTGSNGSGKSLIRKQIHFRLANKIPNADYKRLVVDVSMQRRTESDPLLGAMSNFMHDDPENPTSLSTYQFINTLFKSFLTDNNSKKRYFIIDEPEIGMSKESQLGFVQWLKNKIPDILNQTYGLLIITHSEIIVEELKDMATFLNIDSECTSDEWINRNIVPTDFEQLDKNANELYYAILNYSKQNTTSE